MKYRVTINKRGKIPRVGYGPIRQPILINEDIYELLIKLGYPVNVIGKIGGINDLTRMNIPDKNEEKPVEKVVKEEVVEEEIKEPESIKLDEEEVTTDEVVETVEEESSDDDEVEIIVNDKDLVADSYYTEEFLSSKNICKKILDNRQVQYESNASYKRLKELVLGSNPEVVEE